MSGFQAIGQRNVVCPGVALRAAGGKLDDRHKRDHFQKAVHVLFYGRHVRAGVA